jgi:plasmid rolling circle replication initiator protein Rep
MNGKGDKQRKKTVDQETWSKNWDMAFKKKYGVEVEIKLDDSKERGYIIRRLSADNYEIWCEKTQQTLFLCPKEFKEID